MDSSLTNSELIGKYIWFCATAGNARFFSYTYPQRMEILIDWYRVLNTDKRDGRFQDWGLMIDPDCCKPGAPNCPARHMDETYGFDWCPGDENLLSFVGKRASDGGPGYRDPACDLSEDNSHSDKKIPGKQDHRQSSCDLAFGTSTGALGFRKFPNPRFDRETWVNVNGRPGTWEGYQRRLDDASIEPPFLIGMACGACHIAFDPLKPPKNPAHPQWENLSGTVGNQYSRVSQIFASGMPEDSLEWQVFAYARPGVVDTSGIPTDSINNPGTMNAIINLRARPPFEETVTKWRKTEACPSASQPDSCWCEFPDKCWERSTQTELVPHILKGGEDSIGLQEAIQRVYINIGNCGEEAWVNHLTDPFQLDPRQRNFGQTPFRIGQARRDCPYFRAIEDRLPDLENFLLTARPTDLYLARGLQDHEALEKELNDEFGTDAVKKGEILFRQHCARCHSSQNTPPELRHDFRQTSSDSEFPDVRQDWLGNDELIPASQVGTHWSRALHTNHMTGHVWEEFSADSVRQQSPPLDFPDPVDGGRGYYRNISLLSVWAHAPFMHNNAIGPELCGRNGKTPGKTANGTLKDPLYRSPYVTLPSQLDQDPLPMPYPPDCWAFDPTVEGRFKLFKASMEALLSPDQRIPKVIPLDQDIPLPILPKVDIKLALNQSSPLPESLTRSFPKGFPTAKLGNFNYKHFVQDLLITLKDPASPIIHDRISEFRDLVKILQEDSGPITIQRIRKIFKGKLRRYLTSSALVENEGHRFGETLSLAEKGYLTAFLATL
ncbi:MAG: cytochrome c [Nitrospirales bacterium]|nr:cytochrome c [Nitrospirales bacterium]